MRPPCHLACVRRGLRPLLEGGAWEADLGDFPQRAADCIAAYEARCAALCAPGGPAALVGLTGREREIAHSSPRA